MWNRKKLKVARQLMTSAQDALEIKRQSNRELEAENDRLRRENNSMVCTHMDRRESLEMEIAVLKSQMGDLLVRLRTMRNAVEQFRETLMQADHGDPIAPAPPPDTLDKIRDGLGIARDGSDYKRPVQW